MGALALAMGITFAACSDDDDPVVPKGRSKEYKLQKSATDGTQVGTITLSENADSSVNLSVTLKTSAKDIKHPFYLIKGAIATPVADTLTIDSIAGTGAEVTKVIWNKAKISYDSAVKINAFSKVVFSATKADSIIAIGNVLKSSAQ